MTHLRFSVSHHPAHAPGEEEGVDYHFIEEDEFQEMLGRDMFLEHARVHAHRYGTSSTEYERAEQDGADLLLDLDVQGGAGPRRFADAVTVHHPAALAAHPGAAPARARPGLVAAAADRRRGGDEQVH